ncbi:HNH endonuclease [Rhizobium sp. Leaf386]|uniref:HNH endonuclease n=1 Tax=Rhizobium sp. Leaf386 TaxID=1736359 RepID=UPI0007144DF5|nr:HNH endonuclease [Rhizobium sp. Leaf386]KQT04092.1 hypothetical protein ASG50_17945 [Rhizobium sp. Leaf386]
MNRKQFIQSYGADCVNWTWSWSFVNHAKRFVIFGIWEDHQKKRISLILHKNWVYGPKGHKSSGYGQSLEHIHLVEHEGYSLRTFPMERGLRRPEEGELSSSAITGFKPELTDGRLIALPDGWYVASIDEDYETIAQAIEPEEEPDGYPEGGKYTISINAYERSREARVACLKHFGSSCQVCQVDFGTQYGDLGEGYIHVHHIVPISKIGKDYIVDPIKDLVPVCPNCHAMLHRKIDPLTVGELQAILESQRSKAALLAMSAPSA